MDLLLGLDVGTTAVKALAFTAQGQVVASAVQPIALLTPQPGWVEQDPEQIWAAAATACRAVAAQLPASASILGISVSSQGGTTIPVDAGGMPTHAAFSWMDERTLPEALDAELTLGKAWVYRTTGWTLYAGLPLNHIAWFRKHHPAEFARTKHFCFVNDFVLLRLCAEYSMDPSNASITQLYNLANGEWDPRLCAQAGIQPAQLSPIVPSGQVIGAITRQASQQTGLPAGIPVVNGAHDQYCAAVSTGITRPGPTLLSCGTAWVVLAVAHSLDQALDAGLLVSRHAVEGKWGGLASMGGVGSTVEWFLGRFWSEVPDPGARYQAFNLAVAASEPGAGGLIFTPLAGGHNESGELDNRGIIGLTLGHTRGDLARALMEGIALELRWLLDNMRGSVQVERLKMIGGAARSPIWPQIVADVTGWPVEQVEVSESASLGAALLAGIGTGCFSDADSAFRAIARPGRLIEPNPALEQVYQNHYRRYRQVWNLLPHRGTEADRGD